MMLKSNNAKTCGVREHLYQKCLRCPWLWGCGLWWCSQWWCWQWGCSTETPADPLDSPSKIIHNNSGIVYFLFPFLIGLPSFSHCGILFPPLAACVFSVYLSASPYSLLSLLPPAHCHISPGSIMAAGNDITQYILSHLLFTPPPSPVPFLSPPRLTHAAIAAWFELLPESLHVGQVQFVEGNRHLSNGVISAEPVIVKNLQV